MVVAKDFLLKEPFVDMEKVTHEQLKNYLFLSCCLFGRTLAMTYYVSELLLHAMRRNVSMLFTTLFLHNYAKDPC